MATGEDNTSNERTYGYKNEGIFATFRQKISATVRGKKGFLLFCALLCSCFASRDLTGHLLPINSCIPPNTYLSADYQPATD